MAELSLAIFPLVLSSLKYYHDVLRLVKRFRKYDIKLRELQQSMKTQRTIFREQIRLPLSCVMGSELSKDMIHDPSHPKWEDERIERRFMGYLGDIADAFKDTVETLQTLLDKIQQEILSYESQAVVKRIKFVFSESRIATQMDQLRRLNQDLHTLVDLSKRSDELDDKQCFTGCETQQVSTFPDIKSCQAVRKTSELLHETLRGACNRHASHDAYFRLNPTIEITDGLRIHFDIGYMQPGLSNVDLSKGPLWFSIESSNTSSPLSTTPLNGNKIHKLMNGYTTSKPSNCTTAESLKRFHGVQASTKENKHKRRKRKNEEATEAEMITLASNHVFLQTNFADLPVAPDLCMHIRNKSKDLLPPSKAPIGCLRKDSECSLIAYTSSQPLPRYLTSLLKILQQCKAQRHLMRLSQIERVRFAKLLATAAFQFNNTPWLKIQKWSSKDLILCDGIREGGGTGAELSNPYINVPISAEISQIDPQSSSVGHYLISNQIFFGLALMLVEIAFEQPLKDLEHEIDRKNTSSPTEIEFATAKRMTRIVHAEMGRRYRRVVESCLNYGLLGGDFEDEDFQQRYFKDVILELSELERMFSGMDLNS